MPSRLVFGALALLPAALALPAALSAQTPPAAAAEAAPAHVRVTARILVLDTDALTRAGLSIAVLGSDRVRVASNGRRTAGGVRIQAGVHDARAFLDLVRTNRLIRSESTQQVLALSGAEAVVSSMTLSMGRRSAHTRGPMLAVVPTVLADGRVHMQLSARVEDAVTYRYGYGVDGSPAAVDTEVIALPGEEVIVGSSSAVQSTRESGLLWWAAAEHGREVLVAITAEVVSH